jgi:hypothetical protein
MDSLLRDSTGIKRGRSRPTGWFGSALFGFVLLAAASLQAATLTASLDRDTITMGENTILSFAFSGGQPQEVPAPPEIPNLAIAYLGPSSQFSFINGQVSSSVTHKYTVTPRQPGDYTIPALTADVGGEKLTTQPLVLKVVKAAAPSPDAINSGTQLAFFKLVVPKKEFYVGESFSVELQLYLHSRVQRLPRFEFTGFTADGFNVGKMVEGQRRQAQVGNSVYTVIPLTFPLKAIKAGPMTLGPVTANVVVELPSANRRRDPFDFFEPFNRGEQRQFALTTDPESVQNLNPPKEGAPPNFTGAVGNYTMSFSAGPTNVAAGDPITVKIQIAGRGSLDSLSLPEQPAWHDFKTYPPTTKVETSDPLGLQGAKTFEQIVVPQNADIKALPGVSFSFFDPEQKGYRMLGQPDIALTVRPGGTVAAPTVLAAGRSGQEAPPSQDIVPNKQRLGTVAHIGPPLVQQTWFLTLQGVPVLAFISAVLLRRRSENLANNPRLRRQRQVAVVVRDGLAQLRQLAAANKSEDFFATLFHLLQEQLGERLDLPASAITEAVVEERLRPRGVSDEVLSPLQDLFQTCNLARYAPIKTSEELAAVIPRLESVLRQLQELKV